MPKRVEKSEEQWKAELGPAEYRIIRQKGTEPPFTGEYVNEKGSGVYRCRACGTPLFDSETKYDSGSGWPSFYAPVEPGAVEEHPDDSLFMRRTEIACARCDAHLGHVFDDGPQPTGLRYCINGVALNREPKP